MGDRSRRPVRSPLEIAIQLALLNHQVGPRPSPVAQPCATCGRPVRIRYRSRCPACYQYWYRHGVERPARLWR